MYTSNQHNSVYQLYLKKKLFEKREKVNKKHLSQSVIMYY